MLAATAAALSLGHACALAPAAGPQAPRETETLRLERVPDTAAFPDDLVSPIRASVFALSSHLFDSGEVLPLLGAVRSAQPARPLVVLTDGPLHQELARAGLDLRLIDTGGRRFSSWPRDPLSLLRTASGGVLVLVRPNAQLGREEDAGLGEALLRGLPEDLFAAWGAPRWATSPVPFHNGQVLLSPSAAWISIHGLEGRVLEILGLERVPVDSFTTAAGIDRYLRAAGQARDELAALYRRPVRFVHPLPEQGGPAARSAAMRRVGGGGGFDLDSYLTLLPAAGGRLTALVGDVRAGSALLERLPVHDLDAFAAFYGLASGGEALRGALGSASAASRPQALADYLDMVAEHLAADGLEVRRLPILLVPTVLLRDRAGVEHLDFLVGWNNVVVETAGGVVRAEGFASSLAAADEEARRAFALSGCRLTLFPALRRSVVLNGGYRCASNHLRGP